jgi:hypothetical protein
MYKITVLFESNVKYVYTKEEETATDRENLRWKINRIVARWFKILVPHVDLSLVPNQDELLIATHENYLPVTGLFELSGCNYGNNKLQLILINHTIDFLNKYKKETDEDRTFNITIEDIK